METPTQKREMHKERTLVIIKPDGVQRGLVGEIIRRYERTGLKFVAFKFLVPTREQCLVHYNKDDAWLLRKGQRFIEDLKAEGMPVEKDAMEYGKGIIDTVIKFMMAGPVLAMVIEGNQSVAIVTKITGTTEPSTSDVGTIRGDLTVDSYSHSAAQNRSVRNLIHCSDSPEEAEREMQVWFKPEELINYRTTHERILYDVDLDGIFE
ncbi:nucleoside-diphosphate kinase [Candidatus Kaiserbacteria bacterium]|nr:nucleoside-diphosphate kinase [Candidatus Kaiserbacteria bacterium]